MVLSLLGFDLDLIKCHEYGMIENDNQKRTNERLILILIQLKNDGLCHIEFTIILKGYLNQA